MSFLSPAFLAGALVAALPIVLHLVGRRPQARVIFPAVRLLKRAPAQETRRRRLRELVLLALRVSAILLLALAFARPYFASGQALPTPSTIIVAVDRSFSMTAPGQFARAVSLARKTVARAPAGASVGLLAFDDDAEVLARPTVDRTAVLRALDRLQPGYGATSYSAALARAADALGTGRGRVVIVTDLQRNGWERRDAAIAERLDVSVEDTGGPASNLSVSDLRRVDGGLAAVVHNSGDARRTGRARLTIDGRAHGTTTFALEPASAHEITFPGTVPATGEAAVEIDDATGYQADNKAYALLDAPDAPVVLVVTGDGDRPAGAFYLQHALEVDGARFYRVETETAARVSERSATALQNYAAVLVLGTRGLRPEGAKTIGDYLAAGGGVLVALDDQGGSSSLAQALGTRVSTAVETPARATSMGLVAADARHPVLQPLAPDAFAAVHFVRLSGVDAADGDVIALFADGRPAIVEVRRPVGRLLIFGFDVSNRGNDLPLQPAFLPLMHQVARYLAGNRLPARDVLVSAVPPGVPHQPGIVAVAGGRALRRGSGQASSAPTAGDGRSVDGGRASSAPTAGGRVSVGAELARPRRVVVNVDPRESDIARMSAAEFEQSIGRRHAALAATAAADVRQAEQQQGLWRLALAIAVMALLAEGLLGSWSGAAHE